MKRFFALAVCIIVFTTLILSYLYYGENMHHYMEHRNNRSHTDCPICIEIEVVDQFISGFRQVFIVAIITLVLLLAVFLADTKYKDVQCSHVTPVTLKVKMLN